MTLSFRRIRRVLNKRRNRFIKSEKSLCHVERSTLRSTNIILIHTLYHQRNIFIRITIDQSILPNMRKLIRYIKLPLDTQINFSTHPNSKFPIPRIKPNQAQTTISESSSTNTLLYTRLHDG